MIKDKKEIPTYHSNIKPVEITIMTRSKLFFKIVLKYISFFGFFRVNFQEGDVLGRGGGGGGKELLIHINPARYIFFPQRFLIGYLVLLWFVKANENMTSSYYKLSLYRQIIYVNTARSWFMIYFSKSYDWLVKLWLFVTANENIHLNTARSWELK